MGEILSMKNDGVVVLFMVENIGGFDSLFW